MQLITCTLTRPLVFFIAEGAICFWWRGLKTRDSMARSTSADFICRGGINSLINEEGSYLLTLITAESLDLTQSSVERQPTRGKASSRVYSGDIKRFSCIYNSWIIAMLVTQTSITRIHMRGYLNYRYHVRYNYYFYWRKTSHINRLSFTFLTVYLASYKIHKLYIMSISLFLCRTSNKTSHFT